jgi:hypothetical protein
MLAFAKGASRLESVEIRVMLLKPKLWSNEQGKDDLDEMITELMGIFPGLAMVVADEALVDKEMKRFVEGCNV